MDGVGGDDSVGILRLHPLQGDGGVGGGIDGWSWLSNRRCVGIPEKHIITITIEYMAECLQWIGLQYCWLNLTTSIKGSTKLYNILFIAIRLIYYLQTSQVM